MSHLLARVLLRRVPGGHPRDAQPLVLADVAGGGDVGAVARIWGVKGCRGGQTGGGHLQATGTACGHGRGQETHATSHSTARSDTSGAGHAHHLPLLTGREVEEEGAVILPGLLNEAHRFRGQHICRCGGRWRDALWDAIWDACHLQCTGAGAGPDRRMSPVRRGVL